MRTESLVNWRIGRPPLRLLFALSAVIAGCSNPSRPTCTDFRIAEVAVPPAACGAPYRATLAATGGKLPYSWSLASGSLPPGLTLSSSGATLVISGVPTAPSDAAIEIRARDAQGCTATQAIRLAIGHAPGGIGDDALVLPPPQCTSGGNVPSLDLNDFSVEGWINIREMPERGRGDVILTDDGYALILGRPSTGSGWVLRFALFGRNGEALILDRLHSTSPPLGSWIHVAAQFTGATGKADLATHGTLVEGSAHGAMALLGGNEAFAVGGNPSYVPPERIFKGRVECLRITVGRRYTRSFTPPSDEPPADGSTRALWYLNERDAPFAAVDCDPAKRLVPCQGPASIGRPEDVSGIGPLAGTIRRKPLPLRFDPDATTGGRVETLGR